MRHRIDAGSALVAVGAAILLVSLFLDWYEPGLSAWTSFEVIDLALAGLALAALVGAAGPPGPGAAMVRWGPLVSLAALLLVASQLVDPPPGVDGGREAGAWLALAATLALGLGSALAVASISVTVDVQGRDRRAVTVDRRRGEQEAGDEEESAERLEQNGEDARGEGDSAEAVTDRPTQAFETLERPTDEDAKTVAVEDREAGDGGARTEPPPRDRPPRG